MPRPGERERRREGWTSFLFPTRNPLSSPALVNRSAKWKVCPCLSAPRDRGSPRPPARGKENGRSMVLLSPLVPWILGLGCWTLFQLSITNNQCPMIKEWKVCPYLPLFCSALHFSFLINLTMLVNTVAYSSETSKVRNPRSMAAGRPAFPENGQRRRRSIAPTLQTSGASTTSAVL